jgi:spore coat polysaccharide biosynthesis protein SpsF
MKNRTIAIIQARMGATRLPGKVLLDIGGKPMLVRVVERLRQASLLDEILVATTSTEQDDVVAENCRIWGYPVYRGSPQDVLDRYYQAALRSGARIVVRITADCPVIDPGLVDETIRARSRTRADYATNRLPPPWKRTYPIGLDVETCTFQALKRAWQEADQKYQREHVMPFFYEGIPFDIPGRTKHWLTVSHYGFRVLVLNHWPDYGSLRWTVDTVEDLTLMRLIYDRFDGRNDFSWLELLELFKSQPELSAINANVVHKTAFDTDSRAADGTEKAL